MSAMDLFIGELILGGYHSGASPFLRALWNGLQLSPIWRCNILQKYFATFAKKHLQKTVDNLDPDMVDAFFEMDSVYEDNMVPMYVATNSKKVKRELSKYVKL